MIDTIVKKLIKESGLNQIPVRDAMGLYNGPFRDLLSGKTCVFRATCTSSMC